MNNDWLGPILARNLGRVKAPDELWDRVRNPAPAAETVEPRQTLRVLMWSAAAAMIVLAAGVSTWEMRNQPDPATESEIHASQALSGGLRLIDYRSDQPEQVRDWVYQRTGLEIPMPQRTGASIRLIGAHVGRKSEASILYQVEGLDTVLLVSKADASIAGDGEHRFLKGGQHNGARTTSWTMHGQLYTVACPYPQNPRSGCILCHAGGPPDVMIN